MEQSDLLRFVVEAIERLGLQYFVTGSTVTIFYGEPRFTNDIDIVLQLPASAVHEFCSQFPEADFYVSEESAIDAVNCHSQFNIIHPRSGLKIDIIIPVPDPFNSSRFERARRISTGGEWSASFASPEDAILKKMQYFAEGGSEKHLRDIAGVLKTSGEFVDFEYLDKWSRKLGVEKIWREILDRLRTK